MTVRRAPKIPHSPPPIQGKPYRASYKGVWIAAALVVAFLTPLYLFKAAEQPGADWYAEGWPTVIDGDTLKMDGVRVRLYGIDAPELKQECVAANEVAWPCGAYAREHLDQMFDGVAYRWPGVGVKCRAAGDGEDRWGRVIAKCELPNGLSVNRAMVEQGWALNYDAYSREYQGAELSAKEARRGIWAGTFDPPWEWRKAH